MFKKKILMLFLAASLTASPATMTAWAETATTTMENCGAYLFEWRPVDCGNGQYFAILVGGNTIEERNVILNRGYDYAYTFDPTNYPRTWGTVPDLVNVNGVWAIPENWASLPEGTQPTLQIVLRTNNKRLDTDKRYINVVHLPSNVLTSTLPPEVRKYLINVDGSDAGAYSGTEVTGWTQDSNGKYRYRKPDNTFVTNGWLSVDDQQYYMDADGYMLADTITPDGVYVNASGERTKYMPGWAKVGENWKYVLKNGYYAASTWVTDTDGKSYYFDMAGRMVTNDVTPDGYRVDANGVWDGQPSTGSGNSVNPGPGAKNSTGWIKVADSWKYIDSNNEYAVNTWRQSADGRWYYLGADGNMATGQTTPDGYTVGADGAWDGQAPAAETAE